MDYTQHTMLQLLYTVYTLHDSEVMLGHLGIFLSNVMQRFSVFNTDTIVLLSEPTISLS